MSSLAKAEIDAIGEALDDEYKAWATYDQVLRDFGPVRPFTNIREAERRHIAALLDLCRRYGIEAPPNDWIGRAPRYASIADACRAGVEAEIANAALYDRLLASTRREDILTVFNRLREASQTRHLAAFRRCAEGRTGTARGPARLRVRQRGGGA